MLFVTLVGLALTLGTVLGHYAILYRVARFLDNTEPTAKTRVTISVSALIAAHLLTVLIYAVTYYGFYDSGRFGSLAGHLHGGAADYFYFSLMNFTTLGVGDIRATGPLRILCGFQSLNGFVLLGLSGSFTFVVMRKSWSDE